MKPLIGTIALLTIALVPAPAQADGICTLKPEGETPFPGVPFWEVKQTDWRITGIVQWVPFYGAYNPNNGVWRFTGECALVDIIEDVVECTWSLLEGCPSLYGVSLSPVGDVDGFEMPVPAPDLDGSVETGGLPVRILPDLPEVELDW